MLWRWMSTWKLTSSNRKWSKMANAQTFPFAIASNINDITLMLHELINVMLNYRLKSLTNIIEQVEISKMATLIIPIQSSIAIWNFTSELMPSQATFQTDLVFENVCCISAMEIPMVSRCINARKSVKESIKRSSFKRLNWAAHFHLKPDENNYRPGPQLTMPTIRVMSKWKTVPSALKATKWEQNGDWKDAKHCPQPADKRNTPSSTMNYTMNIDGDTNQFISSNKSNPTRLNYSKWTADNWEVHSEL